VALKNVREEGGRKYRTYSGAKCSIVEHWFSVSANCFVECICTQIINYDLTNIENCTLICELG
jgi:hypothetical protein